MSRWRPYAVETSCLQVDGLLDVVMAGKVILTKSLE